MDFFEELNEKNRISTIINSITDLPGNYVGSKRRLLSHIWSVLDENKVEFESVFDAFSGGCMVSLLFKQMGKKVICNDLLSSSSLIAVSLLEHNNANIETDKWAISGGEGASFVKDNYCNRFFTEKECSFLDNYISHVKNTYGPGIYVGKDINGNDKYVGGSSCKDKCKSAFSLFAMQNHINQCCFLGGRYYSGQTLAKLDHRLQHDKNKNRQIFDIPLKLSDFYKVMSKGDVTVYNADAIELLSQNKVKSDLIYIDPPYGGNSSDYVTLYSFLEEYLYGCKLNDMNHIQSGRKRFSKNKGYQEQFELFLSLCNPFKYWLLSYNESSYADLDTIINTIKRAGRSKIIVHEVPITYQYRAGKNIVKLSKVNGEIGFDPDAKREYTQRGMEYLILAR